MTDPMSLGSDEPHPLADQFIAMMAEIPKPDVIEFGTKKWDLNFTSHHEAWVPHASTYLKADIEAGEDVDWVADLHDFADVDWLTDQPQCQWDGLVAIALLEHVHRPWIAMRGVATALRPRGLAYLQSHQSFVLHGYPDDRWRFTRESLTMLAEDAGLDVIGTSYTHRATIVPQTRVDRWNTAEDVEAYLCVDLLARKP